MGHRKFPRKLKDKMLELAYHLLVEGHYNPEQIVGYCNKHGYKMVSHETLYKWIWSNKKSGRTLFHYLRCRERRYRKRVLKSKKRGAIQDRKDISERPEIVDQRIRFGDFEMDTIVGASTLNISSPSMNV